MKLLLFMSVLKAQAEVLLDSTHPDYDVANAISPKQSQFVICLAKAKYKIFLPFSHTKIIQWRSRGGNYLSKFWPYYWKLSQNLGMGVLL